jgi:hypothetical protein
VPQQPVLHCCCAGCAVAYLELAEAMACVHSTASAVKHRKYITLQMTTAAEAGTAVSQELNQCISM